MTAQTPHPPLWRRVLSPPTTRLGWYSVGLGAAFLVLFMVDAAVLLPAPGVIAWREALVGIVLLSSGIGGGIATLIALIRHHEHSALVWLALLPGLFVLFMIGEFVVSLFDLVRSIRTRSIDHGGSSL